MIKNPRFLLGLLLGMLLISSTGLAQPDTEQQLGLQFFSNREFQKAAEVFERMYKKQPDHFTYTYYLQSLVELGELNDAAKIVKQQIKRFPNDARYKVDEGFVMTRDNQALKAQKLYEDLVKELKPEQRAVIELANAFANRREYDLAIKTYQKGRQLLAPQYTFGFELAYLYELQGQYPQMVNEYLGLLDGNEENSIQVQSRLQSSLNYDPDNSKSEALRQAIIQQVQEHPDNLMLSELMVWMSVQLKDFESALLHARAIDRRMDEGGRRVFELAHLAVENGNYEVASEGFQYVMNTSNDESLRNIAEVELLTADYNVITSDYPVDNEKLGDLAEKFRRSIEKSEGNILYYPLVRELAHVEAFYLDNANEAISLLQDLIQKTSNNRSMQAECKLELADIFLLTGEQWEATLLYSQVDKAFKNDPIGHEARFRNARLSFYIGEFEWARAQLDVLKAATSKLIANDAMAMSLLITDNLGQDSSTVALGSYARADLLLYRYRMDASLALLDSVMMAFPGHPIIDDVLMKKAEINMIQGQFSHAEALYLEIINEHGQGILSDDAKFKLANLYRENIKDNVKAMAMYQDLMMKHPGSLYTFEARKLFRSLRGDQLQ